jgi:hydroxypyruvate reductase
MPNLTQLRLAARDIFDETLFAADAGTAVRRAVHLEGSQLTVQDATLDLGNRCIYSIAIGKAALPMALALEEVIGERFTRGLIVGLAPTPPAGSMPEACVPPSRWQWCEGGHPLPTKTSLVAAKEAFALLDRGNKERALLIFLISGGGSAMLEWPIHARITLADLRMANKVLINCGASIVEINSVRRAFSAVKGGRLAERASNCDQITLIVSDVPSGQEQNVASGPTLAPLRDSPDPREVLTRYHLRAELPEAILRAIEGEPPARFASDDYARMMRKHFVLLDNDKSLAAAAKAARQRGFVTEISRDINDQWIEEGCAAILKRLEAFHNGGVHHPSPNSICLVSGGEFSCPVNGNGIGGRNQETALRLTLESENLARQSTSSTFVALCTGTDGIDGNSPAAGAIVDSTTIQRARAIGLDPEDFLARSDAYSFFVALGDAVTTGVTGTNVRDIRILLAEHHASSPEGDL